MLEQSKPTHEEEYHQLQARRLELKKILQGEFEDDKEFEKLTLEMADNLQGASSSVIEGDDRAVLLAAYLGLEKLLKKTARFKLGQEFVAVQEKIKKMSKPEVR